MSTDTPRPRLLNRIWYVLGRLFLFVSGWRVEGRLPTDPKYIIIALHTSGWDLIIALVGMAVLSEGLAGIHFRYMIKKEMIRGPLGWLLLEVGALPIDRSRANAVVEQSVEEFARHERMVLIITPEATRKRSRHWKSGFYHIAVQAGVRVCCGVLDYHHKVVGPGLVIKPSGDLTTDMCIIKRFYEGMMALYPDQVGEITVDGMGECPDPQNGHHRRLEPEPTSAAGQ